MQSKLWEGKMDDDSDERAIARDIPVEFIICYGFA